MQNFTGLQNYVESDFYRKSLKLPEKLEESYTFLAQGEYNINYFFIHPTTTKKMVLRINTASQMQLDDQINYECQALELLTPTKRTPKPIFVDNAKSILPYGVMVMEYLEGKHLDYQNESHFAAEILADIHSHPIDNENFLLTSSNPLIAILEECESMALHYYNSELQNKEISDFIKMLMRLGWEMANKISKDSTYECCINTELNSSNFLITGEGSNNYLVDWEKPLRGDPAQDLGHFLAPTTTLWKTDTIFSNEEIDDFIAYYIKRVDNRFSTDGLKERIKTYIPITCLRGITWSAMAWVQYQDPNKLVKNNDTWIKLNQYLDIDFLKNIKTNYFDKGNFYDN